MCRLAQFREEEAGASVIVGFLDQTLPRLSGCQTKRFIIVGVPTKRFGGARPNAS